MKMRLKDGKTKVLTLSYDDGLVQDIRLIEIMNKHGLKGTFNINSGLYFSEDRVREKFHGRLKLSEAKELYTNSGHEIAVHALTHPSLGKLDSSEIIFEIIEDRKNIESQYGVITRGMAYPFGAYNDNVVDILEKCHIAYARTVKSTHGFAFPESWLTLHPTCHHNDERLEELIKRFVETPNVYDYTSLFRHETGRNTTRLSTSPHKCSLSQVDHSASRAARSSRSHLHKQKRNTFLSFQ